MSAPSVLVVSCSLNPRSRSRRMAQDAVAMLQQAGAEAGPGAVRAAGAQVGVDDGLEVVAQRAWQPKPLMDRVLV